VGWTVPSFGWAGLQSSFAVEGNGVEGYTMVDRMCACAGMRPPRQRARAVGGHEGLCGARSRKQQ
jgi:hypothetical protein